MYGKAGAETSVKAIEDAFKEFTNRDDIAIIMINQYVGNLLRSAALLMCPCPTRCIGSANMLACNKFASNNCLGCRLPT